MSKCKRFQKSPISNFRNQKSHLSEDDKIQSQLFSPVTPTSSISQIPHVKKELPKPKTICSEQPPQTIPLIEQIRKQITEVIQLINKICIENESTPEIEEEFRPFILAVEQSMPDFFRQAIHYFVTMKKMEDTAKQNMILSSALVRKPVEQFSADWASFCQILERLSNQKPSPHGHHITMNFLSISHTLDSILQANNKRMHPCTTLSNTIFSIQSLGDSLNDSIVDLFSQPTFPNFEIDLLSTYRHDVKAFLRILTKAFASEFPKSGIQIYDLTCIKSDVFTQVHEILLSLESAFSFHSRLGDAVVIKNEINTALMPLFSELSIEFRVIKPNPEVVIQEQEKQTETIQPRKVIEKDFLTTFCQNVGPKVGSEVHRDNRKNLLLIEEQVNKLLDTIDKKNKQIEKLIQKINDMDSYETLYKTQSTTYNQLLNQRKQENEINDKTIKSLDSQIEELKLRIKNNNQVLNNQESKISQMRNLINEKFCINIESKESHQIIDQIIQVLENMKSIDYYEKQINDKETKLNEVNDFFKSITKLDNCDLNQQMDRLAFILQKKKEKRIFLKEEIQKQVENNEQKINELTLMIENDKIESEANSELHKEEFEEMIQKHINQLKVLIGNENLRPDLTFDNCILLISEKINEMNLQIREKNEKIKKRKEKQEKYKEQICQTFDFPLQWKFRICVNQIIEYKNSKNKIPVELQQKIEEQNEKIKSLYLRLLGMIKRKGEIQELDSDSMMQTIFFIIDKFQDDQEHIDELKKSSQEATELKSSIIELEKRLSQYLGRPESKEGSVDLMKRVYSLIDVILDPDFNSQYVKVNELKSFFRVLNVDATALPSEYIPAFCKIFDEMERSFESLPQIVEILTSIREYFSSGKVELTTTTNEADFRYLDEKYVLLNQQLANIQNSNMDENLVTIITDFVWLTHIFITRISSTIFT